MSKIIIDEIQLRDLLGYVQTILDFVDVEDFESQRNKDLVVKGFDDFVGPIYKMFDKQNIVDERIIAKQVDIEMFKEDLENIYDVDTTNLTDQQVSQMFDDVWDELANDDQYAEIYNDAVWSVLKQNNLVK